jgi:hypothetical protein
VKSKHASPARQPDARAVAQSYNALSRGWHADRVLSISSSLSVVGALLLSVPSIAAAERLEFDVLLDGKPIGTHRFEISASADNAQRIDSEAVFRYRLLGIPIYRYHHRAAEQWIDGCLARIEASTDDNGDRVQVRGELRDGRFRLEQPAPALERTDCVSAYAYWDRNRLLAQRELLNPQTGRFDAVRFEVIGQESLIVRGARVSAERIRLLGDKLQIDLWYSPSGEWLQLLSVVDGGKSLRYERRN